MLGSTFYFGTMRNLTAVFGAIFAEVVVVRFDASGNAVKTIKVPLAYGPKQKWLQRVNKKDSIALQDKQDVNVGFTLPRMAFEITNIQYDSTRQTNAIQKLARPNPTNPLHRLSQRAPVPYDVQFDLHIIVKNTEDGRQIIEQILPYFTPEYSVTVKEIPELDVEHDVPIIYSGITKQDSYDGSFMDMRVMTWTLSFVAKTHFYPPILDGSVIKTITDNFYTNEAMEGDPLTRIIVGVNPKKAEQTDVFTEYVSIDLIPVYDSNGTLLHYIKLDGTILNPG